ncbi:MULTISPECIES: carboxymuconolactone decarboxylase family protein [Arcicella]|uniref:Carboxymuconolactone decarboxylase family protein n=1 Tax=Arcicella lustrica TaxID=2984196 RepID=A0ABU5SKR2_9BACT|nr:carboxymuconolactone decarboxylase family protein [Arcicella sp. DC25W]MEA5427772.1 carboxymuconolactone decarboxylase family protein [Arcicella sp. DC25W]|eukprot:Opistho-2@67217
MEQRIKIQDVQPAAWKAMYGLETYLASTEVSKTHKELIKIRASQINACAFCIDLHTTDAIKNGETTKRIFLLNAWKETDIFSEEEKVVLAIAEEITLIHLGGLSDKTYQKAKTIFSESYIAQLIMVAVTINAWNRIAISTQLPVAH